ncbi:MAG: hypothetical protein R3F30_00775 [Planctomycetota bacterium]
MARLAAWLNRGLDMLPPGRWMHRWVRRGMHWSEVELPLARGGPGLDGLRVAFLSDLHAGSYLSAGDLDRIFGQLAERRPELVCPRRRPRQHAPRRDQALRAGAGPDRPGARRLRRARQPRLLPRP